MYIIRIKTFITHNTLNIKYIYTYHCELKRPMLLSSSDRLKGSVWLDMLVEMRVRNKDKYLRNHFYGVKFLSKSWGRSPGEAVAWHKISPQ